MSALKISVVVPFYNTPSEFFSKCIEALQKLKPFEVILVDDCSTLQETIDIAKNSGFTYLKTPYQSGHDGLPLNIAVAAARGDYICRVDSDDVLLALPKKMKTDICFGYPNRVKPAFDLTLEELILGPRALCNALVAKKEIFLKHPFATDSNVHGDILFVLQLLYNKYSFDTFPEVNYIYTERAGSILTSKSFFHNRLINIQTVARLCQIEQIDPVKSLRLLHLAMLNVRYGSDAMNMV